MSWSDHMAASDLAVAAYFDETPCRLQPRAKGATANHPEIDDPLRAAFEFFGTVEPEPPADRITRHLSSDPGIRNGTVSYEAVLTALISGWPYAPVRYDVVEENGRRWKIVAKEDDGSARPAWYLVKA